MTKYVQDSTPTNPFGIGYFQQGVDTSKKLIAERQARDRDLVAQSNAIDTRTPARELAAARASGDAQAIAAADARYQAALAEKDAVQKEIQQNTALLASTEEGLRRNETALALAESKAAGTPPNTVIVNAGNDPQANSTPPVYTVPLNETTPSSSSAQPVRSVTGTTTNEPPTRTTAAVTADPSISEEAADPQPAGRIVDAVDPYANSSKFSGTATATNSDAAEQLAIEEARTQAFTEYGPNTQFAGVPNLYVKINDNGTYTATYTTVAQQGEVTPPVNTDEDPGIATSGATGEDLDVFYSQPEPVESVFDPGLPQEPTDAERLALSNQIDAAFGVDSTPPLRNNAQQQNTLQNRVSLPASADWRVRLSLAQNATYLYRDANNGILAPLSRTNGVVFPYTPSIELNYAAKYDAVDLTHSNYRGYFYRNSTVDQISVRGTFTAQDTREAEYLLAVITFLKAVTKMFYGATDPLAGTPPPLVFLSGLGQYQFSNHPCVVSSFQYSLPSDVDYIRANGFNNYGINLDNRRQQSSGPAGTGVLGAIATVNRLLNNSLVQGALGIKTAGTTGSVSQNNSNTNYTNSTYVPTKMEINLTLLPIQTRSQVSTQFNVQDFASGKLLQQGFW